MTINRFLVASLALGISATVAHAADAIITEEPPVPVVENITPAFSWSGIYFGGQAGYGFGKTKLKNEDGESLYDGNGKLDGFLGGVYAGYNFDLGNSMVLGIDGDVTYNKYKKNENVVFPGNASVTTQTKSEWGGAARLRAGYAVDRFLPYIAGGVALAQVKNSRQLEVGDDLSYASLSKTRVGYTVGAGVDYAATDNVVLRLEYRFTDLGTDKFRFNEASQEVKSKLQTNDIRVGVAYKF
jgi:outer membrane immunogenic protein